MHSNARPRHLPGHLPVDLMVNIPLGSRVHVTGWASTQAVSDIQWQWNLCCICCFYFQGLVSEPFSQINMRDLLELGISTACPEEYLEERGLISLLWKIIGTKFLWYWRRNIPHQLIKDVSSYCAPCWCCWPSVKWRDGLSDRTAL